jgi:histidinol-phosphate aminotransferase
MELSKFIRQNVQQMKPYSSAIDEFEAKAEIYLNANENPYQNGINRYPDPYQKKLKSKIAQIKNIAVSNIFFGNGSDEVIDLVLRAFCEPQEDNIIITPPTYGMYKVAAELNNVQIKESLLNADFSLNVDDLLRKINVNTKVVILCSPNNPSGNCMDDEAVQQILKQNCLVFIDEAYIDFSERESWSIKLAQYPNLIITQTLSKAYGMAGIRIGMCFASEEIIQVMNKIKPPYNINELSQQKAIDVLDNEKGSQSVKEFVLKNKNTLYNELFKLECVEKIYPSEANFFLVKMKDAEMIYNKLLDKSIVVRDRSNQPNCENCLRITVGTEFENKKLIIELKKI